MDKKPVDRSDEAEARRMRWMLAGNGYFMEEEGLCGHGPCDDTEQDDARRRIDDAIQESERFQGLTGAERLALLALEQLLDLTDESDWPMVHATVRKDVAVQKYGPKFEAAYQALVESKASGR